MEPSTKQPKDYRRQKAIDALELRQPRGLVPTFEVVFQIPGQAVGRDFISENFEGVSEKERQRILEHNAELHIEIARKYDYSAIMSSTECIEVMRRMAGDEFLYLCHGDPTFAIPGGDGMMEFSIDCFERPEDVKARAEATLKIDMERARQIKDTGTDGFIMCSDYCFNHGPFLSPKMFAEFITPYLARITRFYRDMGYYVIKHTDGNIMPILDQIVSTQPHGLHSLDPMAGVDIAEVKRLYGKQLCLIGNVNCALMQTGTEEEVRQSAAYALEHGMPGGGYIFSTSNCVYTGMPLERYELMLQVRQEMGWYPE